MYVEKRYLIFYYFCLRCQGWDLKQLVTNLTTQSAFIKEIYFCLAFRRIIGSSNKAFGYPAKNLFC